MRHPIIIVAALASLAASGAHAQAMPRLPGGIGGLPNISSMGLPNVAGVLGYCVKNKFLSGSGVGSVVDGLKGKPGVASSPDYRAGSAGNIITGSGSPVALGSLPSNLKTQACNMVLEHGTKLL